MPLIQDIPTYINAKKVDRKPITNTATELRKQLKIEKLNQIMSIAHFSHVLLQQPNNESTEGSLFEHYDKGDRHDLKCDKGQPHYRLQSVICINRRKVCKFMESTH